MESFRINLRTSVMVQGYEGNRTWQSSPEEEQNLKWEWNSTPSALLKLVTDYNGVVKLVVKPETSRSAVSSICCLS